MAKWVSELNERRKTIVLGNLRDIITVRARNIETLEVNWPWTFLNPPPTHDWWWRLSIPHSNQLHLRGRAPNSPEIFSVQFLSAYLSLSERHSRAIRHGWHKVHIWKNMGYGCDGKKKQRGGKVTSTQSYLAPFDQGGWWIREDSPEVST